MKLHFIYVFIFSFGFDSNNQTNTKEVVIHDLTLVYESFSCKSFNSYSILNNYFNLKIIINTSLAMKFLLYSTMISETKICLCTRKTST